MTLAEIEAMAREVVARGEADKARAWMHDYPWRDNDSGILARFILAVLPVVRAIEEQRAVIALKSTPTDIEAAIACAFDRMVDENRSRK